MGYVQGLEKESTLPPEDYIKISRKLNKYGGLYIYRDNVRVLPYGDNNFDWIDMERRRSQNAAFYFFSYRRIFGLLNINQENNPNLGEKAGREGFRENKAYRQFRDVIERFFVQLAADFFRKSGEYSEAFTKRKNDSKMAQAAARRERELKIAHDIFEKKLSKAFQNIEQRVPHQDVEDVIKSTADSLENVILSENPNQVVADMAQLEAVARRRIRELREQYNVTPPAGVGLSTELRRQSDLYASEFERLDREIFQPAMARIQEIVNAASDLVEVTLEPKNRLRKAVDVIAEEVRRDVDADTRSVRTALKGLEDRTTALLREVQTDINASVQSAIEQVHTIKLQTLPEADIIDVRLRLEDIIIHSGERAREVLHALAAQLDGVQWNRDSEFGLIQSIDETAALEEELLALRERTAQDLELVQLGMAIDIINHEFTNTITSIRNSLRRLQAWGEANPRLGTIYQNLRAGFDHLDGYLTLFTPLHRRLYRTPTEFTGADIAKYLTDLFGERLEKYEIELEVKPAFRAAKIVSFPSTFYPVLVNLVDNATYWLQDARPPRIIRLDAQGTDLLVSDSGPGISLRDRDAIFQSGFTRKPGGRGLGLFISRDVLGRVGWQLTLEATESGNGSTFRMRPATNTQGTS